MDHYGYRVKKNKQYAVLPCDGKRVEPVALPKDTSNVFLVKLKRFSVRV